ncbi:MAG: 5-formyltetrahydrofolate cyclo-ligase [Frankiales bacterium]|nr:5-formyltetrahydrofolate cyclo-ligase [Frankiales bacterium]
MEGKRRLREQVLARRRALTADDRAAAGEQLAAVATQRWTGVGCLAAYAAVGAEPPTRQLLDALHAGGACVLLPVVAGEDLHWAAYAGWDRLRRSDRGLLEPDPVTAEPGALETAEVVLVPALAVDRHGHRLGRGAGYYDRSLTDRAGTADLVAVVYDDEVFDDLPVEPHDIDVRWALTPTGLLPLGEQSGQ